MHDDSRKKLRTESREALAAAEMAALCAVLARRGLSSPYGGDGWTEPDLSAAEKLEVVAVDLVARSESLWEQARSVRHSEHD